MTELILRGLNQTNPASDVEDQTRAILDDVLQIPEGQNCLSYWFSA